MFRQWLMSLKRKFVASGRGQRRRLARLQLEPLEGRVVPVVVTWTGAAGTGDYTNPNNWDTGVVPTASDDVVIAPASPVTITVAGGAAVAKTISSTQSITVSGTGQLTVVGSLSLATGRTLSVSGAGALLTAGGGVTAPGASLSVAGGGQIRLPGLTTYASTAGSPTLSASGPGSVLALTGLTTLTGPTGDLMGVTVQASSGGLVQLPALTSAAIPAGGPARNGIQFLASGAGSLVDLSALTAFADLSQFRGGGESGLTASDGGEVRAPQLTTVDNVALTIAGVGSVLPVTQYTAITNGRIAVSGTGNVRAFPALANADGSGFSVTGGASLDLPGVAAYTYVGRGQFTGVEWTVTGGGSVLALPIMTTLVGPTGDLTGVSVLATSGGRVDLGNLQSATIPEGGPARNGLSFAADGAASLVDLSALTVLSDETVFFGGGESTLSATAGGEVRAPHLTAVDNVGLTITGSASVLPTAQYTRVSRGYIAVSGSGVAPNFTSLTDVDGSGLSAAAGARLALPGVRRYTFDGAVGFRRSATLSASGAGSVLDLAGLNAVTLAAGTLTLDVPALTLSNLTVTGGTLGGSAPLTVTRAFTWSAGRLDAGGQLSLAATATGRITGGSAVKVLARPLANAGRLTYDGVGLFLDADGVPEPLANLAGGVLSLAGDGDVAAVGTAGLTSLVNDGLVDRGGGGDTRVQPPVGGAGSLKLSGGTLRFDGGGTLAFDGLNYLDTAPGTTLRLTGPLAGTTTNADAFAPLGTVTFAGGSAAAPLALEAMSQDRGAFATGYDRNFAYGTLRLDGAYLRLEDAADNAAGGEAVYADTLIVPAGSTLDLNGKKLYARAAQIDGAVVGGTVTVLPDGGPLALDTPTAGRLAAAGQVGEWTFFGRAGQRVVVVADPGGPAAPPPIDPRLGRVTVQVLDAAGNVLASGTNTATGVRLELPVNALPADGTYRVRVSGVAGATGNYRIAAYNGAVTTRPLTPGQVTPGALPNPYSVDRWTFSTAATQLARFRLLGSTALGATFKLTGPGGVVVFSGLTGDSGLLTLPAAGQYTVEVGTGGVGSGGYAFALDLVSQTALALGTPYTGTLTGDGFAQVFVVTVPEGNPLALSFDAAGDANRTEVYARLGAPPTRQRYDAVAADPAADHSLLVPFAAPGTWYVLVYAPAVPTPGAFTIRADSVPLAVAAVIPVQYSTGQSATLTVRGAGFLPGTQVELVSAGGTTYPASSVGVDSISQLTVGLNLLGVPAGVYGVRVTLPTGTNRTLPAAFQVVAAGAANLETRLILPSALGRHAAATLYVEYANTGTAAMPAPVLTLRSGDPDGSDRPLLTLDQGRVIDGFWSTPGVIPDGFATSVQLYASGATPGVLQPGERVRVPVYYIGLLRPWDFGDDSIEFQVDVHDAGSTQAVDWAGIQAQLKPEWMAADAWAAVVANLQANVGSTYGDYVRMLSDNATSLARLGQTVTDVGQLYGFEVQQAAGLTPVRTLASAADAAVPTPGLPLSFGRSFGNTITERYQTGPFGRGWSASWQTRLTVNADGVVVVGDSPDSQRRFQPNIRTPGSFSSQAGDAGTLRGVAGGAYELTESNGQVTRFRADGTLEYVQDTNGNRITTTYTTGRLTTLTHSSGASLSIAYNAAGRITSVTDSAGRVTSYGYDPTNTYLLTVTGPGGTTTYTYIPETTGPTAFALASVTDPSGVGRFFGYDARGRLTVTYLSGNAERVVFAYDAAGKVTATDAAGVSASTHFDHRGLVVRTEDGTGAYVNYEYDADRHLSRETDSQGRSRAYTWCGCGSLLTATDEYGRVTAFEKGGPNNQPLTFTDANGNVTRYGYDAAGNLTSTTYADGSVERAAYDAVGNPIQLVNRRGQAIGRTFNAAGQLVGETFPDGPPTTYTYDARNRLATATDGSGTTTFTYDSADRLTRVDYPGGRFLAYTYDAAGRRTRMEDETGFVTNYTYDAAGRLKELRDGADALIVAYSYDAAGRLGREDKGNGTYTLYGYDTAGRVLSIVHHAPGGGVNSRFVYGYDAVGRRVSQETIDGTWAYTYDLSGQLTRAVFTSVNPSIPNQDLNYEYDALGNRVRTVLNGVVTNYTANNLNQYTAAGATTFQYDLDGNLISESGPTGTKTYTYNSRNRLTSATTPDGTFTNEYDVFGNRRASTANGVRREYLLDLFGLVDVVGEYDATGTRSATYTHGLGLEAVTGASGRAFYDFDAIGSTAGLSGAAGGYVNRYAYEPFGGSLMASETRANSFEFVGEYGVMAFSNALFHMRARSYSIESGRFSSQDPIRLLGGDFNFYRYAANNPISFSDPSGLSVCWDPNNLGWGDAVGANRDVSRNVRENRWDWSNHSNTQNFAAVHDYLLSVSGGGWQDIGNLNVLGAHAILLGGWILGPGGLGGVLIDIIRNFDNFDSGIDDCPDSPPDPPTPPDLPGDPGGGGNSDTAGATDPNEKFGAAGYGPTGFIAPGVAIPYRVNFENLGAGSMPTPPAPATAPAQRVEVTDQLSAHLDWSTLAFTEFGFGDTVVSVPAGRQSYSAVLPITVNGKTFDVEVNLWFDATTGLVRVVFQSVDRLTGLPPDVLTGFLPPEDGTGRGQGFFAFTVRPKAGLPTGTQILNVASIVFDGQPPITTNQVSPFDASAGTDPAKEALNTIDAGTPTSGVNALPVTTLTPTFTVSWAGQDDAGGSGVAYYDVFVSVDGGAYTRWLKRTTATSATYTGAAGHTYRFYSVATDNVGLVELPPATADANITVEVPPSVPPPPVDPPVVPPVVVPPVAPSPVVPPPPVPPVPPASATSLAVGGRGSSVVRLLDPRSGAEVLSFVAFPGFEAGVNVASGDVTGDGVADLFAGAVAGGGPHVKLFDGAKLLSGVPSEGAVVFSFFAYDVAIRGGVNVALGDVTGDGLLDLITGAGAGGGPHVKVFDGRTAAEVFSFFAFDVGFAGGVNVAAADFNGDGKADVVTGAAAGGGPHVKVIDTARLGERRADGVIADSALLSSFYAYNEAFTGGVSVAVGDLDGDGFADLITGAGSGGGPHVRAFGVRSMAELVSFFAYDPAFRGGVTVAAGDVDGDGREDLITGAGPGGGPHVRAFDASLAELASFYARDEADTGGVSVAYPPVRVGPRFGLSSLLGSGLVDGWAPEELLNGAGVG